jgi:hypothetical protein
MIKREILGGKTKSGTPYVLHVREYDDGRCGLGALYVGEDFVDVNVDSVFGSETELFDAARRILRSEGHVLRLA